MLESRAECGSCDTRISFTENLSQIKSFVCATQDQNTHTKSEEKNLGQPANNRKVTAS